MASGTSRSDPRRTVVLLVGCAARRLHAVQRDRVLFGSAHATQLRYRSPRSPASAAT
jgi:hypothetical protein